MAWNYKKTLGTAGGILLAAGLGATVIYLQYKNIFKKDKSGNLDSGTSDPNKDTKIPILEGNNEKLNIMSWNILNFGGEDSIKNSNKVLGIAKTILYKNSDIVALQEINDGDGAKVKRIVDTLNELDKNNQWVFASSKSEPNPQYATQREQFAFVYKSNKVDLYKSDNLRKYNYVRYPFIAYFRDKNAKNDFALINIHLDSPGSPSNPKSTKQNDEASEIYSGQGNKEVQEAQDLAVIIKELKKDYPHDILVMGDTNIKNTNNLIFETKEFTENGIKLAYKEFAKNLNEYYKTSLSTLEAYKKDGQKRGYVNAYDKFIYLDQNEQNIMPLEPENYRVDLLHAFDTNGGWLNLSEHQQLWYQMPQNKGKYVNANSVPWYELIRGDISDHAPVMIEYKLNQ
ncbi:membrane nuclease MnuA [Mycoplasmopsis columbina SF7]|uniref:Membrane nuclease MnuA n=1 Tax=Mycoplasmopsis columbina SF7 TaxID=1037410 RepID=F9UKM7_9BACT|nr:endonuclease/exonuclease/phosphatase family protein [Mycoplasmopsis columbina]EGV00232.1 membrane nuclease MnuA [Mycoplasmopsis columbina SF7]